MKKVFLMALAIVPMMLVSCKDDEKDDKQSNAFSVDLISDGERHIVEPGKQSNAILLTLENMQENRSDLSVKFGFSEENYDGKIDYQGVKFDTSYDFASIMAGGNSLSVSFLASENIPASGKVGFYANVTNDGFTATDTIWFNVKRPTELKVQSTEFDVKYLKSCIFTARIEEDLYNGTDEYDLQIKSNASGSFNCNTTGKIKPNEDININYYPTSLGVHKITITVKDKNGKEYQQEVNVTVTSDLNITFTGANIVDGNNIYIAYVDNTDYMKPFTMNVSKPQYSGTFSCEVIRDDSNIQLYKGTTSLLTGEKTSVAISSTNSFNISAMSADPAVPHKLTFKVKTTDGAEAVMDLNVWVKVLVRLRDQSTTVDGTSVNLSDFHSMENGYYDYNSVLPFVADFNVAKYGHRIVPSGWSLNSVKIETGATVSYKLTATVTAYPIIVKNQSVVKTPASQYTGAGTYTYGATVEVNTTRTSTVTINGVLENRYWYINGEKTNVKSSKLSFMLNDNSSYKDIWNWQYKAENKIEYKAEDEN